MAPSNTAMIGMASADEPSAWTDPNHPEIDYSGSWEKTASDDGSKTLHGWWAVSEESDNYPHINSFWSAENKFLLRDNPDATQITAECIDGDPNFIIFHGASTNDGQDAFALAEDGFIDVAWRVDGGDFQEEGWPPLRSRDGSAAALYDEQAQEMFERLMQAEEATFRLDQADGEPTSLVFALAGAREALRPILEACAG